MPWKMLILLQTLEFSLKSEKQSTRTLSLVQNPVRLKIKGCVTLWPCHLQFKILCKAEKELWKLKNITMQKYNLQNIL